MILAFEALAVAGMLGVTPAPASIPRAFVAPPCASAILRLESSRLALGRGGSAPRGMRRFAASLGASLAWDLADLPRRQSRLPDPIGGFTPGSAFLAPGAPNPAVAGGAIGALITRWNALYPPYALALDREVLNDR